MFARLRCIRWGAIAVMLSLTACSAVATAPRPTAKASKQPGLSVKSKPSIAPSATPTPSAAPESPAPSASPSASATPTPLPSVALILSGRVTIDPRALLGAGMAERTPHGIKLIGNHGAGLISDKGLGLIANNGGNLIGKTKYALAQLGGTSALAPAEGMLVEAFDLLTGKLVAGPVATDPAGNYQLGFLEKPGVNLQVVARVNNTEEAKYAYPSLSKPKPDPIETSDDSRAVTTYILAVVPSRLGPIIDARKAEDPEAAQALIDQYASEKKSSLMMIAFNQKLATVPAEKLRELDADGQLAMGISRRMLAYADLDKAQYLKIGELMAQIRTFDLGRETPADPPLTDQVIALMKVKGDAPQIPAMLTNAGMDPATALLIGTGLVETGNEIAEDLASITLTHQAEVLGPLAPFFPGGLF